MEQDFKDAHDRILARTREVCAKRGLTLEKTVARLKKALHAKDQKAQWTDDGWQYSEKMEAWGAQLKAVDLSLRLLDAYPSEKHEHSVDFGPEIAREAAQAIARKKRRGSD